jgi:hypothetical protein
LTTKAAWKPLLVASCLATLLATVAYLPALHLAVGATAAEPTRGEDCESGTIYVAYQGKAECLALYNHGDLAGSTKVILFIGGDMPDELLRGRRGPFAVLGDHIGEAAKAFHHDRVPIIILARPGMLGSTGDHRLRHREVEYRHVGQAIEKLVAGFRWKNVALVGGSGGSSAIMGALSLGMKAGNCILAASGAYEFLEINAAKHEAAGAPLDKRAKQVWKKVIFSHRASVTGVPKDISRRIFLIGDRIDPHAPFAQQVRYAGLLQSVGLNVRMIEAKSPRGDNHSFTYESLRAAASCLRGESDGQIVRHLGGIDRTP